MGVRSVGRGLGEGNGENRGNGIRKDYQKKKNAGVEHNFLKLNDFG